MIAVGMVLVGCTVNESSRSGGLIPPTGPAPTAAMAPSTVVTVAAATAETWATEAAIGDTAAPRAEISDATDAAATDMAVDAMTESTLTEGTAAQTTSAPSPPPAGSAEAARSVLASAVPLEDFREGVMGVSGSAGSQVWPVIIADTPAARRRGLMGVADFAALGGYAAMVFVFESETSGAFWMRDTPLPLRITFVAADGSVVSGTDMVPCMTPAPADECERYFAAAPYRLAIEHPVGPEFDLGLADADLVEVTIE